MKIVQLVLMLLVAGFMFGQRDLRPLLEANSVENPQQYGNGNLVYIVNGDNLMSSGLVELAILEYDNAIEADPMFAEAYVKRGMAKYRIGRQSEAEKDIRKAYLINPYAVALYSEKFGGQKMTIMAQQTEELLAQIDTQMATAYESLLNQKMSGNYLNALKQVNQIIDNALNPDAIWYKLRGNIYLLLGEYESAIADYNKVIFNTYDFAEAYFNRGIARILLHHRSDGCSDLMQGITLGYEAGKSRMQAFCGF